VRLVDDSPAAWSNAIREALADAPITWPLIADRILSFDEVARRHLNVFEDAMARRQLIGGDRVHAQRGSLRSGTEVRHD
jgi:hypothetical protein